MIKRGRRLRQNPIIRSLARETRLSVDSLIWPLFIQEGSNVRSPIAAMEGQFHFSPDRLAEAIDEGLEAGVNKFLLFGLPGQKDALGSDAYDENGIVQQGLRTLRERFGKEIYLITDICMCEYTDHGHCGILHGSEVDNDETLSYLDRIAVSHAIAGADMVAPSDMMDGRVASIRAALDGEGFLNLPIMSYAVKYASAYYGPFRDAAGSAPAFGDRKSYQMDFHNVNEALREAAADEAEGADMLMVKPALSYLDVIRAVRERTTLPLAAYSVSGEYAMIKAGGAAGLIDEYQVMCESAVSVFRAGADSLITYFAKELAGAIRRGDIG
ncbi:MAG: Porphobilinogen synthase [Oscillospiraceae bacterium]|nr:Porphobilinogen synthase [Oscillospiraceae bacterium]